MSPDVTGTSPKAKEIPPPKPTLHTYQGTMGGKEAGLAFLPEGIM